MVEPVELFFSIHKAMYLFTQELTPERGGDKQKFWREVLGFNSHKDIRIAILNHIRLKDLYYERTDR